MDFPELNIAKSRAHWNHSSIFGSKEYEYIKSFVHKDYSLGYHTHSFYELNIVLSGFGFHYIEKMACCAEKGCVFLIPPNIKHGYISKDNLDVYHMLIHRNFVDEYLAPISHTKGYHMIFETEPYLRGRYKDNLFLTLSNEDLSHIHSDITLIDKAKEMHDSDLYINSIAQKIISHLCLLMENKLGVEKIDLKKDKEFIAIAECLNYIHQNFDEKITISYLAEKANMSRSTFIRHFKKICNCSPHRYIKEYRIKKAEQYLFENKKTSTEIAQECGFYDVSHLRKQLK